MLGKTEGEIGTLSSTDLLPPGAAPSCCVGDHNSNILPKYLGSYFPYSSSKLFHPGQHDLFYGAPWQGDMCKNVPVLCYIITFLQIHGDQYSGHTGKTSNPHRVHPEITIHINQILLICLKIMTLLHSEKQITVWAYLNML